MRSEVFWWLVLSAIFFAGGEALSKLWVVDGKMWVAGLALVSYVTGSALWLPAIWIDTRLAVAGTVWSLFSIVATVLIGAFFGERLHPYQIGGILLALIATYLITR